VAVFGIGDGEAPGWGGPGLRGAAEESLREGKGGVEEERGGGGREDWGVWGWGGVGGVGG